MNISFFGPRIQDMGGFQGNAFQESVRKSIQDTLTDCLSKKQKPILLTGLSIGIDQWAAGTALDLKIPYVVYVPFDSPESKWPKLSQKVYTHLLKNAQSKIIVGTGEYSLDKIRSREQRTVDDSDIVYDLFPCGQSIIKYAKRLDKTVINILPSPENDDHFISL